MDRDEAIDLILQLLNERASWAYYDRNLSYLSENTKKKGLREGLSALLTQMGELDLIRRDEHNCYHLKNFGIEVLAKGGWVEYLKLTKESQDKEEARLNRDDEIKELDRQLKVLQIKNQEFEIEIKDLKRENLALSTANAAFQQTINPLQKHKLWLDIIKHYLGEIVAIAGLGAGLGIWLCRLLHWCS